MLIVNHYGLHRFERDVDNISDALKALVYEFFSFGHLEVELQILNRPFASMCVLCLTVICCTLLNGNIGQMDHHIIQLGHIGCVLFCTEASKTSRIPTHINMSMVIIITAIMCQINVLIITYIQTLRGR